MVTTSQKKKIGKIKSGTFARAKLGRNLPYRNVFVKSVRNKKAKISWSTGSEVIEATVDVKNLKE